MTAFARVGEHTLVSARVHVPAQGPWFADVVFERDPDVSGRVSLWLGGTELVGTIDPSQNGVTGLQRRCRIVAGGGGWGTLLAPKAYHNDGVALAGGGSGGRVRARTVADDAARETGETIGDFAPAAERIGADYVRETGVAARVLEDVIGGVPWWVDYLGRTNVGARPSGEAAGYQLLEVDAREKLATLAADELDELLVGYTIEGEQLDEPATIRELTIDVGDGGLRVRAWFGGGSDSRGRLADSLVAIIERIVDRKIYGPRRYRVVQMSSDRVELQAVNAAAGVPDILPVSMWPGVAGAHAEPTAGAEVLVQFIEGDRTMPIVTHFAGKDGTGWTPANLTLDVTTLIKLGKDATKAIALAEGCDSQLDDINTALDTLALAVPSPNDGGAALHTAFTGAWGSGAPLKPPSDVGASKVVAE